MILPPALERGSRVHVVAPSGPFDRCLVLRGMGWLSQHFRVSFRRDLFERRGFLAGGDERRFAELSDALVDPSIEAIVTARGGHGLLRILPALPLAGLRQRPKWVIGFSDPTALHCELGKFGVASLHAANVAGLGRGDALGRAEWLNALLYPHAPRELRGQTWRPGLVKGTLFGGNLTLLTMLAASGRLTLPHDCILAIEDVTETSYRVDRMLTTLHLGGYLDRVAGFAIGQFTDCGAGPFRVDTESVLREHLGTRRPAVARLAFGHDLPNHPLTLGAPALLDANRGVLVTPGELR
jgi:muramoyltetrapeptide carboxypeptidase